MRSSALMWCWWSRGDRWMRGRTVKRARSSRRSGCKTRTHTQFLARTSARAGLSPLATGLSLASPLGTRVPQNQNRAAFSRDSAQAARATRRRPGWQSRRPTAPTEWPGSSRRRVRRDQLADPRVELLRDLNRPPLQQGHKTAGVRRDRPPPLPPPSLQTHRRHARAVLPPPVSRQARVGGASQQRLRHARGGVGHEGGRAGEGNGERERGERERGERKEGARQEELLAWKS